MATKRLGPKGAGHAGGHPPTEQSALDDVTLDEIEAVARIGAYSTDLVAGRWVSSKALDAILGIDAAFDRSVEGWISLVHPADREAMVAYLTDEVLGRAQPFEKEYRILRPDTGETRWMHGRGALELDPSGRPIRMLGTIADITETHRAQEALLASELRYTAIFEGAIEAILVANRESQRLRWVNPAACALLGYTRDELLRLSVPDIHPPADLPAVLALFAAQARGQLSVARSVPCRRRDGSTLLADIKASSVIVDGVACNVAFFSDVTERVAAEAERNRLATAVEQSSDSVVITDLAGTIEYANPAFERVSGYRREAVIGRNPRILKSGQQSTAFYRALWRRLTRGESWTGRFVNRRADDVLYQVEATISPIRDLNGHVSGYIGVERDVTALQAARSGLANEFRERAQVAAALAHLQPGPTIAATAADICDALVGLAGVDGAAIITFPDPEHAVPLAVAGPDGLPLSIGRALPATRAAYLYERASQGPWAEAWRPRRGDGEYGKALAAAGVRAMAYAPIGNGEGLLGVVAAGTRDESTPVT